MDIYILTLADSIDRYNITTNRLIRAEFSSDNFHKHIGIHGIKEPELLSIQMLKWNCTADPTPAQRGCSFSHLDVMEKFLKTDKQHCMIVEDDLILPDNFSSMFQDVLLSINGVTFDILFIGWEETTGNPLGLSEDSIRQKFIPYYPMCQHCYVISKCGAEKICNAIKKDGLSTVLDVWISTQAKNYDIVSLCVNPSCYNFVTPSSSRMNRANGIAFQDNNIPSTIDL